MSLSRTLSIVGASEETTAHIRLLLRIASTRLEHPWQLQNAESPDLIIIEPQGDLATSAVKTHCKAAGIPYAVICDQDEIVVHGMALRRPLKMDQLVAVLNAVGNALPQTADSAVVAGKDTDFYNAELGDQIPRGGNNNPWDQAGRVQPNPEIAEIPARNPDIADGVDAFDLAVKGDPLVEPPPKVPLVDETTELEPIKLGTSARHAFRRGANTHDEASLLGVSAMELEPIALTSQQISAPPARETIGSGSTVLLSELLQENAIQSPMRISAAGLPDVVLDPKLQCYYSSEPLEDLLPYASADTNGMQTSSIAGNELQRIRDNQPASPLDELRWLLAIASSKGRLNPGLDPGGSYSLKHVLPAAPELHSHGRIAALMTTPMPLHEIARASGARMEDVFDIVNAYHAIGQTEYIPRRRLQEPDGKGGKSSLWSRLKGK